MSKVTQTDMNWDLPVLCQAAAGKDVVAKGHGASFCFGTRGWGW